MSTPLPPVSPLAMLAAAKSPSKAAAPTRQDFEAALSAAQHGHTTPVLRPQDRREHPTAQQRHGNDGETPQHPVLHPTSAPDKRGPVKVAPAKSAKPGRAAVPVHKSTMAHPEADPVAAAELQPARPAPVPAGVAGQAPGTASVSPNAAALAGTGDSAPAAGATAPAQPLPVDGQPEPNLPDAAAQPVGGQPGQQPTNAADGGAPTVTGTQGHELPPPAAAQAAQQTAPQPATAATSPVPDLAVQAAATPGAHQHQGAAAVGAPTQPPTVVVTASSASPGRPAAGDPAAQDQDRQPANPSHGHATADGSPTSAQATPYSPLVDRGAAAAAATGHETRTAEEMPATQSLPAGTLDRVNAAEHSVRLQVETDGLGRLTAELHTRPGEIGVHLSVPDDAGRALMAQRMDALRDSLGQSGSAVHLSLAAQEQSSHGQQGYTPREDRAPAQSAPQPHDAATPRATDGSPAAPTLSAPADGSRLVDVRA